MLKQRVPLWSLLFVIGCLSGWALAGRNSGGTYSLPVGNPVISGTTITSTWANSTLGDLGTEVTNSLDRQGRGGMSAPLKLTNGALGAPGLTSASETTSGLYRPAAGDWRFVVLSTAVMTWTSSLISSLVPFTVAGRTTTTDLTVTGSSARLSVAALSPGEIGVTVVGNSNGAGVSSTGGAANGTGVSAIGGASNGVGLSAVGAGSGPGITSISAGTGVGVIAGGGTGSPGLRATAGTPVTSATSQDAIEVVDGYISLNGVITPLTGTNTRNRLTPKNLTQAWAAVGIDNGSTYFVNDSYGMTAPVEINLASCTLYAIQMTLNASFPNAASGQPAYVAVVGNRAPGPGAGTSKCRPFVASKASNSVTVQFLDTTTGLVCSKCGAGTSVINTGFDIMITGAY